MKGFGEKFKYKKQKTAKNISSQEQIINQAIHFHLKGNIREAAKCYQYCINQGINDHRVFANYAGILQRVGKLKEAELFTRKALEIKPDFAEAHSNLGSILSSLGKLKEAELSLKKAIEIKPDFADAYYNLGNILRDISKLQEAEISYRRAIKIKPNYAEAHSNLGSILKDLGKLQEAEISYRRAIEIKPNYAELHSNLGSILSDLGKLQDADVSINKAIELDPENKSIKSNLISLLTVYKPKIQFSNQIYILNEEFRNLSLRKQDNSIITDKEAIQVYKDGFEIYRKYNLDLETSLSQIYKRNEINLNCNRHKLIFNQKKIIPEFCFECYKVQVEVDSIVELIKLFLVFNTLELENSNTRKCMVEIRENISGFYKGLIYCANLPEALDISKKLNIHLQNNIRVNLSSKIKRGCSEYALEFPKYKEININGKQPMEYNKKWKNIEKEIDEGNKNWGESNESIQGFSLNDFLIIRNWISYAQKIGDESVKKITNEQINIPKSLKFSSRDFCSKQTPNKHS
ncbi:tetratricopeptide repeat protein [Prochlorococcus sp. AH-716-I09]|nr:tetratricopeptide repeat protein [Prochlorococcus sp. AH-716-I09]